MKWVPRQSILIQNVAWHTHFDLHAGTAGKRMESYSCEKTIMVDPGKLLKAFNSTLKCNSHFTKAKKSKRKDDKLFHSVFQTPTS